MRQIDPQEVLAIHPAALVFPEMDATAFAAHKEDIRQHGQRDSIVLFDGQILDGRHRRRACAELGIPCHAVVWQGDDPIAYVVSCNLHRRHLSESQRGMVAARIANLNQGQKTSDKPDTSIDVSAITQVKAAEMLNVGTSTVQRARVVQTQGDAELIAAVDRGQVTVAAAADLADLPKDQQRETVARGPEAVKEKAREQRRKKRHGGDRRQGQHRATETEASDALTEVEALAAKWQALGGLKKLVKDWEDSKRWTFCDQLEVLAKTLRRWATELRHHTNK